MALRFNGQVDLFEFKVVALAADGGAPVHLVGVEFSRERRRVVGSDVETVAAAG